MNENNDFNDLHSVSLTEYIIELRAECDAYKDKIVRIESERKFAQERLDIQTNKGIAIRAELEDLKEKAHKLESGKVWSLLADARAELKDLNDTFDLRHRADMRAIAMWRKAHPGKDLTVPDHADLVCWLMEQLDQK